MSLLHPTRAVYLDHFWVTVPSQACTPLAGAATPSEDGPRFAGSPCASSMHAGTTAPKLQMIGCFRTRSRSCSSPLEFGKLEEMAYK